jgi:hypothetical protein
MSSIRPIKGSPKRSDSAELHVIVLDQDLDSRRDANVQLKQRGIRRAIKLNYDEYLGRYTGRVEPGKYELKVSLDPSMEVDRREIELTAGNNTVYSSIAALGTPFYYGVDREKIYFKPDEDHLLLYASGINVAEQLPNILEKHAVHAERVPEPPYPGAKEGERRGRNMRSARFLIPSPPIKSKAPEQAWQALKKELEGLGYDCRLAAPLYRGKGIIEGLTTEFVVSFRPEATPPEVESLAKEFGCEIVHRIGWMPNGYLMRVCGLPSYELLKIVERFMHLSTVIYAEPNVIVHIEQDAVPNDFLLPEQTYGLVIHAQQAWNRVEGYLGLPQSAGSPDITVAVFDADGVSPNHPDLTGTLSDGTAKMVANFDFVTMTNQTVANLGGDHGTACASVAVGSFNNGLGFPGIAGNCHLIGGQWADWTGLSMAYAWIWAAGLPGLPTGYAAAAPSKAADIISNSWGPPNTFPNVIKDALDYLTIYGRGGMGCIVCFSVGNLGYIQFSPIRRYAAYDRTIAVGATISANPTNPTSSFHPDPAGNTTNLPAVVDTRAYYSPYGPEMDLVAPAHTAFFSPGTADPIDGGKVDPIPAATLIGGGHWIGQATTTTNLTAAAAVGATSLSVASTAGFVAGSTILIGTPGGAGREFRQASAVAAGKITVPALNHAHAAGTQVATGPNDYDRSEFGATSHACPTVAGAAALILSVRPELTWIQVRRILHECSDPIDTGQTNNIGRWHDAAGRISTDLGYTGPVFSQWYGYGRLNLDRAVQGAHDFDRGADIVVRDNLSDNGLVPSPGWWAASPDIWVSPTDVPIPVIPYGTDPTVADPSLTNAERGHDNYVFVRVKNVGPIDSDTFYVRALITHFPGFEFRYPEEWMPTNTPGATPPSPLTPGTYLIGEQAVTTLPAGQDRILKFTWKAILVPPDSVTIAGIPAHWHPCLLAEVSPHDGPSPATTGLPVQRDNNLAQRNITVSNTSSDDAFAIVAGTSIQDGVHSLILDRTYLEPEASVFVRIDNERIMKRWVTLIREHQLHPAEPLVPAEETECEVVIEDSARLRVSYPGGRNVVIHAAAGTHFTICNHRTELHARGHIGHYHEVETIVLDGDTIELPLDLAPQRYVPVVIGLTGAKRGSGTLRISQRLNNGEISAGYEIRRC